MKKKALAILFCLLVLSIGGFAQTKKAKEKQSEKAKNVGEQKPIIASEPMSVPAPIAPVKKNERPNTGEISPNSLNELKKKNQQDQQSKTENSANIVYPYVYEFSQPAFDVSHVIIKHDEIGHGTITLQWRDSSDSLTNPIELSNFTLAKINTIFDALDFINSTENYQSPIRSYGHLGNYTITLRRNSKERVAQYNWSENRLARDLSDEYRRISEQYIWYADINLARQNMPLEAPILVDRLDSLLKRNEISDPNQLIPFLKDLSNDERIPLMARNHAARIIKDIEKNPPK